MIEILLVDDETYVTQSLAQTIPWHEIGISQVFQACSAKSALVVLEENSIDIVVTDIRMPEMDGLSLIKEVYERWPHISCILLTGHSDFDYAKKAIQLQVFDYILKPIDDEEFVVSLLNAVETLKDEWSQSEKYNQLMYNRKSDFSILRANLMHELLLGRQLSVKSIQDKLTAYEIQIQTEEQVVMLLVQLDKRFTSLDYHSVQLMEYAIGNIAEEVFADAFHLWHGKAPHNCLILLVSLKRSYDRTIELSGDYEGQRRSKLAVYAQEFRINVSNYLKGDISVLITDWFQFPTEISNAYRSGLSGLFLTQQKGKSGIVFLADEGYGQESLIKAVDLLYKPPTLIHLLESKQWESAKNRINEVFDELNASRYTREHVYEVFLSVTNAFMYILHKQGHNMAEIGAYEYDLIFDPGIMDSLEQVRNWAIGTLDKLTAELSANNEHTKSFVIKQVREIVESGLGQETSVKTIADRVFLHPVYLSKIYKAETGENLGDYIIRMRMEKAHYLLRHSNKKIYEIATELGYQNPQYFSKIFKKYHGLTPNEFRDQ